MNHILQYYHERAQKAYAAAEAADDPRDKAAWKGAAQTWERLSKPSLQPTFSMEPYHQQLAALKRDVVELTAPTSAITDDWRREATTRGAQQALQTVARAFTAVADDCARPDIHPKPCDCRTRAAQREVRSFTTTPAVTIEF